MIETCATVMSEILMRHLSQNLIGWMLVEIYLMFRSKVLGHTFWICMGQLVECSMIQKLCENAIVSDLLLRLVTNLT